MRRLLCKVGVHAWLVGWYEPWWSEPKSADEKPRLHLLWYRVCSHCLRYESTSR